MTDLEQVVACPTGRSEVGRLVPPGWSVLAAFYNSAEELRLSHAGGGAKRLK